MSSQPSEPSGASGSGDGSGSGSRGRSWRQRTRQSYERISSRSRSSIRNFGHEVRDFLRPRRREDDAPAIPPVPTLAAPSDPGPGTVPSIEGPSMRPSQPPTTKASVQFQLPPIGATSGSRGLLPFQQRHLSIASEHTFASNSSGQSSHPSSEVGGTLLHPPPRLSAGGPSALSEPSPGDNLTTGASSRPLDRGVRVSAFGLDGVEGERLKAAGSAEQSRSASPAIPEEQSNE